MCHFITFHAIQVGRLLEDIKGKKKTKTVGFKFTVGLLRVCDLGGEQLESVEVRTTGKLSRNYKDLV